MSCVVSGLQTLACSFSACASTTFGQGGLGYIDPNTTQHVFTFLAPMLAFIAAAAGVLVSAAVLVRHRLACWLTRMSGARLTVVCIAFVSTVIVAVVVVHKLITHLMTR